MAEDAKENVDADVVDLELQEEVEVETPKKRGPIEAQRKGINDLFEQVDKANAILEEYASALEKTDFGADEQKDLKEASLSAKGADKTYVRALREGKKSLKKKNDAVKHAMDQIRKAKRRGRTLASKNDDLKDEFCIGVRLSETPDSVRYQGPLVLAAVKEYFDDIPNYSKAALDAFKTSLTKMEDAILERNRVLIRIKQKRRVRDLALENLREELSDLRLAAELVAETDDSILSAF